MDMFMLYLYTAIELLNLKKMTIEMVENDYILIIFNCVMYVHF